MVSNYLDKKCFVQFHNLDIDVILARVCFSYRKISLPFFKWHSAQKISMGKLIVCNERLVWLVHT